MSKLVRSTIEPDAICIDKIKAGSVRLICHWDINTVEITDEEIGSHTEYEYQEEIIWWALPSPAYIVKVEGKQVLSEAGQEYLSSIENEILDWAKAKGV